MPFSAWVQNESSSHVFTNISIEIVVKIIKYLECIINESDGIELSVDTKKLFLYGR